MSGLSDNALSVLRKVIQDHLASRTESMATGTCSDHAEYKHQCGIIHGLHLAERELNEIMKRVEEA